ncbi:MAG: hypothetical protein CXX72_04935, partial [Methanobacteriota archaeon]
MLTANEAAGIVDNIPRATHQKRHLTRRAMTEQQTDEQQPTSGPQEEKVPGAVVDGKRRSTASRPARS